MINIQELESLIEFLKSEIIAKEYKAVYLSQEVEDLQRRLDDAQIDLATAQSEQERIS